MRGPVRGDDVTLVIPQRERVAARVDAAGLGGYVLWLRDQPRTSSSLLARAQVYVEFAGVDGIGRMLGTLEADDGHHRVRFRTRGAIQLLARAEALRAHVAAPVTLLRVNAPDHVALEARTVEVSGGGATLRGLPGAGAGQLYQADLHLFAQEPAITAQLRVQGVTPEGLVLARFTILAGRERARLMRFLAAAQPRRAA